jgi:uncharacterized protein
MLPMATSAQEFPALAALATMLRAISEPEPAPPADPPPSLELLRRRREEIIATAALFGAGNLRVVGSVARGTAGQTSDLDFLATLDPERSLLDLGGLQVALEGLLGCRVDVIADRLASESAQPRTPGSLREERLLARLLADAEPV